ncbi:hypothetical protein EX895_002427 [Sporisorium graminicola]|uniref:Uncharacterized protein n=1 Tax=Sporisorium graminicola TaxID=280036 RepID=A0A4U7KX03_9BASI|nr:hypothetical protein EX895_002427 [Sporisorium graminicola]TKY88796.1 hypothetical protein EX895_002427 [Sporisorium graminicola]
MRDQPCQCGCGLNAASSSRISFDVAAASTGIAARAERLNASRRSRSLELPLSEPTSQESTSDESEALWPTCSGVRKQAPFALNKSLRSLPTSGDSVLLLMIMLLCSCLATVVASAVPAVTAMGGVDNILAISNTSSLAMPTATASPSSVAQDGNRQLAAVVTNAASSSAPANHNISIGVSQPVMCQPMNITFDPSRGTPPYTVMISFEDYWPVTIDLPATYDDATKDLWLYQYDMPLFNGNTSNPSLIVSVTDSTGLMSNSSSFVQLQSPANGATCTAFEYSSSFIFYTEHAASMCQDYEIFWNGSFAPPMTAIFLPEAAPPIYVTAPSLGSMTMNWLVAMAGGTRFLMTLGDSRTTNGNGGVSKLNIVALNEYVSNDCIAQANYPHKLFAPTTTASPASIFPDATTTLASLTTSGGNVATVTVIETIKNGRRVNNKKGGPSTAAWLAIIIIVFLIVAAVGAAGGWFCYRRYQKRKQNIRAWDLPKDDPSVPFSANPNMPIAPGVFGRTVTGNDSNDASARGTRATAEHSSVSDVSNNDPFSLSSRPLARAPSARASLRSWTSSAFDHLQLATSGNQNGGRQFNSSADDYAMMETAAASAGLALSDVRGGANYRYPRPPSNGSREGWSPTDTASRTFGFYSDDPQALDNSAYRDLRLPQHRTGSPPLASRTMSSDGASTKSTRVGPGPTYRPDAASQAAYQDLLANNNTTSPVSGVERTFSLSATRSRTSGSGLSPTSRTHGWAEIFEGSNESTQIVRHSDAGLLLDDNDNGDELINLGQGRLMELPPEYDTIHPSDSRLQQQRAAVHARDASRNENPFASPQISPVQSDTRGLASIDISDAALRRPAEVHAADLVDENDDESAFWAH